MSNGLLEIHKEKMNTPTEKQAQAMNSQFTERKCKVFNLSYRNPN
jgi:hypothetical protein